MFISSIVLNHGQALELGQPQPKASPVVSNNYKPQLIVKEDLEMNQSVVSEREAKSLTCL